MKKVLVTDYASIVDELNKKGQAIIGLEDFVGNPPRIRSGNIVEFHELDTNNVIQVIAGQPNWSTLSMRCALIT